MICSDKGTSGRKIWLSAILTTSASLALATGSAHAQGAGAMPAASTAPAAEATEPERAEGEIVVTAQKRAQNILDVPISIAAFSSETLDKSGITELGSLQNLVPNFQVSDNVSVRTVYIRGVGGGGRTVAFDTRTGIYLDGVYIGQPMAADAVLTNLERVEVLRGPQGYLYGQNSVSGAVNLITRAPVNEVEGKVIGSYGNKDAVKLIGMVNVPLVDDTVMLRVGGSFQRRDGFIHNVTLDDDVDDLKNYGGRAQLRIVPSDSLTVDISADYSSQLSHKVNGEARSDTFNTGGFPNPPADQPFVTDDDYPERDYNRNWGLALTMNYDLGDATLTSITGYRNSYRNWNVDLDHGPADFAIFNYYDNYKTISQELRVSGKTGTLNYVAGLFFLNTKGENDRRLTYSALAPLLGVPAFSRIRTNPSTDNSSYAAFGALDWEFVPGVTLNSGLRFNHDVKKLFIDQQSDIGPPITNLAVIDGYSNKVSENSLSPSLGITWEPGRDTTLYAKYARGVKSGGFNADYLNTTQIAGNLRLGREKVDSYEVGFKYRTPDRVFTFNSAFFYALYSDYQVSQFRIIPDSTPPQIELALTNAGKVETYGVELSSTIVPTKGLAIDLSGAWLHARYKEFPDGGGLGVDYSGHRLEYAPEFTMSATVDYSRPINDDMDGFARFTLTNRSSQYSDTSNARQFYQQGYALVNGRIGLRSSEKRSWEVALWADNLLNEFYDLGTAPDAFTTLFGKYGTPRTYGIELTKQF
jgi:iron complex outermembrane receptor protein